MPGKLPALHDRFANHTMQLFKKHGIDNVAYWTEDVGTSNRLVYMLGYPDLGAREKGWTAFQADPAWQQARAESEKNGPLVRVSRHAILRLTPYSPDSTPEPDRQEPPWRSDPRTTPFDIPLGRHTPPQVAIWCNQSHTFPIAHVERRQRQHAGVTFTISLTRTQASSSSALPRMAPGP